MSVINCDFDAKWNHCLICKGKECVKTAKINSLVSAKMYAWHQIVRERMNTFVMGRINYETAPTLPKNEAKVQPQGYSM